MNIKYVTSVITKTMNITKDEARILAVALDYYSPAEKAESKEEADKIANAMNRLQDKLLNFSNDQRRTGRRSRNNFSDCLKRFSNCH